MAKQAQNKNKEYKILKSEYEKLKRSYVNGEITEKELTEKAKSLRSEYQQKLIKKDRAKEADAMLADLEKEEIKEIEELEKETRNSEEKRSEVEDGPREINLQFERHHLLTAGVILILIIVAIFVYPLISSSLQNNGSVQTNQCTSDNQCAVGSYCTNYGACLINTCGDGVCSSQEQQSGSCPIDCGCSQGQVLNKYINSCQQSLNVSNSIIQAAIGNYLRQNNLNGTISSITDSYYGNQTVKEAVVNCKTTQSKFPCQIVFFINNKGSIVNATTTS